MKRVLVIGGGITGLAAAHRIHELNQNSNYSVNVTLLEATSRFGGIVHTEHRNGFILEHGPDSFISEKPAAIELAKRLGLESRLIQTNNYFRRSFIVHDGRLMPVPAGFHLIAPSRFSPFLSSRIFSWRGKARMAMECFVARKSTDEREDESVASFVRRRFGREALERVAQPMIGGIYTADPELLSLRATFPRFLKWEQKHSSVIRALRRRETQSDIGASKAHASEEMSGARYSLFLSFDDGMQVLTDELSRRIPGNASQLNSPVKRLKFDEAKRTWHIETGKGTFKTDAVCLTTPAYVAASLLRDTHSRLARELDEIAYESSATINLAYKRSQVRHSLDGFGFVVPFIERRSLIACTFSSVKFPNRAPADHVLLRAFVGGALQREVMQLEDGEILSRVINDLDQLLGINGSPVFTTFARWNRSMPQYHVGHLERIERIRRYAATLPGLVLTGGAYSGVGIPDCISSGETAAEEAWKQDQ